MCGRFTLSTPGSKLAEQFGVSALASLPPRFNIAPGQPVAVVRLDTAGQRELAMPRWGLVPAWAKDPGIGNRLINARAETVAGKPAFRAAFRARRCLVPADGFYEWQAQAGRKQPWLIRRADGNPFAIAGLWESWQNPAGETLQTCTLLTTEASGPVLQVHHRMPVMLEPQAWDAWLDTAASPRPWEDAPAPDLRMTAVSTRVNNVRNDDAQCIAPVADPLDNPQPGT